MFSLHQRLKDDTVEVVRLGLSVVLLLNDRTVPWLILVPARPGAVELHDLSAADRGVLIEEVALASKVIAEVHGPDKINVGALGNIVSQLHIHVIGRSKTDRAWPGPVWGTPGARPYTRGELDRELDALTGAFKKYSPV